jgi:hypothetical protein
MSQELWLTIDEFKAVTGWHRHSIQKMAATGKLAFRLSDTPKWQRGIWSVHHVDIHEAVQLTNLAKTRQKEKSISFSEALTQVAQEHSELTQPGASTGGQV